MAQRMVQRLGSTGESILQASRQPSIGVSRWNRRLVVLANAWSPDVMVVFKGMSVTAEALAACPGIKVHYHPDDSSNVYNRSAVYDEAEAHYDLHVTTKRVNVEELRSRGVREVLWVPCAYDRDWHWPVPHRQKYVVGFIGTRRSDRADLVRAVAHRWRKQFLLVGAKWRREPTLLRLATVAGPQYAADLALTVSAAPVQLGLLNSDNRDQHTCRSYEVPASGGVLIAERTIEHTEMLEDGIEALFFVAQEEMMEHVTRLEQDPRRARRIAEAAAARIRGGRNTYEDRWQTITQELGST